MRAVASLIFYLAFFTLKKKKVYFSTQLKTKCPHHRCWLSIRISYWLVKKDPLLNAWKVTDEQHQPWPVPTRRHVQCISSWQLGGSWINGVLGGHLFQVLFPILFTLHTDFWGDNLCLVPVRRFPGQFTTVISPGRTGGQTPHFFASTKWPETHWPPGIMAPRDWVREICFSFSATWMQI